MKSIRSFFTLLLLSLGTMVLLAAPAPAAASTLLESADYTFNMNLPDPSVWSVSAQGNVTQVPVDGLGLAMADPDNWSQLLYVHPTPYLSGDPNNPNYQNTATFRVRAKVPYINDGSSAWSTNAIGWRMILDDGSHRLELALSREPTWARTARIQMSSIDPVSFPWDNGLANIYEITRLTSGDFVFTLTNADPSSPNPVITQYISAGQLPSSVGIPQFAWGTGALGGGVAYWQEVNVEVHGPAANQPPVAGPISAPVDPVPVNTPVSVSSPFSDSDTGDTHTALWEWGDGTTTAATVDEAGGVGTASGAHTYAAPGVYPLALTVSDNHGTAASATFHSVVVYDPRGGFVTGGGWIDSPAGAYRPDPALAGKATFGFVSKYQKGATVPTGNTQFQFKVADLNFHSSSYKWLVVNQAGTNAQFKGSGTINGSGTYHFMLWAGDGTPDTFRIKIWEESAGIETVIYDNNAEQPVAGGAIFVHED